MADFRSGMVAVVGLPNVGKSSLVNAMVGEKVAIVSPRPQTTRNKLMGVEHGDDYQIVYVDTPGMHEARTRLGSIMDRSIQDALVGLDALIYVIDASKTGARDAERIASLPLNKIPAILVINKIDLVPLPQVLPIIDRYKQAGFRVILPISVRKKDGLQELRDALLGIIPIGPAYFDKESYTDQQERQMIAEIIREKALLHLNEEVPHGVGIEIIRIAPQGEGMVAIHAAIYCEREGHKGIIIGKKGAMLTTIGSSARRDIEELLHQKVNLQLWVKVREDWRNNLNDLRSLGYTD